jgi:hypothetical protein
MRLLIGIMSLLLVVGIATSVQPDNSTNKNTIQGGMAKNITNQTNKSVNQTNITNRTNSLNQTNITFVSKSFPASNGINRSAMETPLKAAFESEPVSSPGYSAVRAGEGPVMGTPSQTAFESYVA